jgi:hypothetical protein
MELPVFIHGEARTRPVIDDEEPHRVRVLDLVDLVRDEQPIEAGCIGAQVLQHAVVVALQTLRDGPTIRLGVKHVLLTVP